MSSEVVRLPPDPRQRTPQPFKLKEAWQAGQLDGERSRLAVEGRRTDDNTPCTFLLVHEHGGGWAIYPHGASQFGVRLARSDALTVAERIAGEAGA